MVRPMDGVAAQDSDTVGLKENGSSCLWKYISAPQEHVFPFSFFPFLSRPTGRNWHKQICHPFFLGLDFEWAIQTQTCFDVNCLITAVAVCLRFLILFESDHPPSSQQVFCQNCPLVSVILLPISHQLYYVCLKLHPHSTMQPAPCFTIGLMYSGWGLQSLSCQPIFWM